MDDARPTPDGRIALDDEDGPVELSAALTRRLLSDMRLRDRLRWCLVQLEDNRKWPAADRLMGEP